MAMDTRRLFFQMAYLFGFKPWDSGVPPPELIEVIEGSNALPPGRAIDLGCGTETSCKYTLAHVWYVCRVHFAHREICVARKKAPRANLLVGDVTKLGEVGVD